MKYKFWGNFVLKHIFSKWFARVLRFNGSETSSENLPILEPFAFRVFYSEIEILTPVEVENYFSEEGLIVYKNQINRFGKTWNTKKPGGYYFLIPFQKNCQIIKLDKSNALNSALILSGIIIRGNSDDRKSINDLKRLAQERFLYLTCGKASRFVKSILESHGFQTRLISTFTMEKPNNYNDGHVLIEVFFNGRWILVDIDKKCFFRNEEGELSHIDLIESVKKNVDYEIVHYSKMKMVDWSGFVDLEFRTNFSYSFAEYWFNSNNVNLKKVYSRICQIGGIVGSNGEFYYTCEENEKLPFIKKAIHFPKDIFVEKFDY